MRQVLVLAVAAAASVAAPAAPALAGGGCGGPVTDGRTARVVIDHACFAPMVTRVPAGVAITFVNESGLAHNITGPGGFGWQDLPPDATLSFRTTGAGVFPYACTLHSGMSGAIVVGDGTSRHPMGVEFTGRGVRPGASQPNDTAAGAEAAVPGFGQRGAVSPPAAPPAAPAGASAGAGSDAQADARPVAARGTEPASRRTAAAGWLAAAAVLVAAGGVLAILRRRAPAAPATPGTPAA